MPPNPDTKSWRLIFGGILVLAMAAATLMPAGLGIVASFIRDDLGISRTQVGVLITTTIIMGAVLSPSTGRIVDGLGGRVAIGLLFVLAGISFLGLAVSRVYWVMLLPVALAGVAQAGGNPATNKLIALHAPPGRRGVVTGIKQSGVQAGVFVGGLTMPAIAEIWGWRWAFAVLVVVPMVGLAATAATLPNDRGERGSRDSRGPTGPIPPAIVFLAVYGGLMGLGAAYTFLVPLFAEEALGLSERLGGLAAGLIGLTSLFARIAWARHADRSGHHDRVLLVLASLSVVAVAIFLGAQYLAGWLLWPGAVLTGVSSSSWNSVGMLAVIDHAGHEQSGRASGVVMLGFLTGLAIGPTLLGWLVDLTGSYTSMWMVSAAVLLLATLLAAWWLRDRTNPSAG